MPEKALPGKAGRDVVTGIVTGLADAPDGAGEERGGRRGGKDVGNQKVRRAEGTIGAPGSGQNSSQCLGLYRSPYSQRCCWCRQSSSSADPP